MKIQINNLMEILHLICNSQDLLDLIHGLPLILKFLHGVTTKFIKEVLQVLLKMDGLQLIVVIGLTHVMILIL